MKFRNETQFTNAVIDLFRMCGWWVHHDRGEMRKHIQGDVGFPDIIAVHPFDDHVVAAELKMPKGVQTDSQKGWMVLLGKVRGVHTYLWRPDDWDQIVDVAKRR